ncbi:MFS transporter [Corynebacterium sp. 335C]
MAENRTHAPGEAAAVKRPLFTVPFNAGIVANCGIAMAMYLYMSTIAGYAIAELGTSESGAGLLSGMFVIGAIAGRFGAGPLTTMIGQRRTLVVSAVFMLLMTLLYPVLHHIGPLTVVRALHGAGFGAASTALAGIVLSGIPKHRRGEGTGWFTTGMTIATAVGPLLGIQLSVHVGHQPVFWAGIIIAVVTLIASFIALPAGPPNPPMDKASRAKRRAHVRMSDGLTPKAIPVALTVMLCAFGFSAVLTYLTPFAADRGLQGAAGFYFLVYAAVILVSRPVAGVLQDKMGDDIVMIPITISVTVGLLLTAFAPNGFVLLLGAIFLGLGYGTQISAGQALAIRRTGGPNAGKAVGSFFIMVDGGTGLGPILLGPVAAASGYEAMFVVCAVLSVLALGWYMVTASGWAHARRAAKAGKKTEA